jgi:SnoaL-like domain
MSLRAGEPVQPSAADVAEEYVALLRQGRFADTLDLASDELVRVAPIETGGVPVELRGLSEIMENSRRLNAGIEIHRIQVDGPFVAAGRFALRIAFDETDVATGERTTIVKMSLFTVADGKIVREEVYYHDLPVAVRLLPRRPRL